MKNEGMGGNALWAKVLGALLLALIAAIIAVFVNAGAREDSRKTEAFEATRLDAQHYARAISDHLAKAGQAADREQLRALLKASVPKGVLVAVQEQGSKTVVLVQFDGLYERAIAILGPSTTSVSRCFALDFAQHPKGNVDVGIKAQTSDQACTDLMPGQLSGVHCEVAGHGSGVNDELGARAGRRLTATCLQPHMITRAIGKPCRPATLQTHLNSK
ncbi:hypothetical protein ACFQ6O_34560 [Streptomyces sp. NPDC056441]|uniref:hypothetical protein n=1 Tax=Streptomyces sp. NPDC056441 TaxID=3345817 RepID=UPI00369DE2FB